MNENKRAFTLIELLIVVAIIAILAAIAVPNFLEAQVRSKVSRAQADMRSLATAIEAYSVDHAGKYPMARECALEGWEHDNDSNNVWVGNHNDAAFIPNANWGVATKNGTDFTGNLSARMRCTFSVGRVHSLTTPTSYITSYPPDPFADTRGLVFGYSNLNNQAWIIWSYGPDCDEKITSMPANGDNLDKGGGQIGNGVNADGTVMVPRILYNWPGGYDTPVVSGVGYGWAWSLIGGTWACNGGGQQNPVYSPSSPTATATLLTAGYTYDTTNGSKSTGDLYRIKQ